MKLDRLTPAQSFEIRMPRWKERVVGLAEHRLGEHNQIEILATGKDGKRYYPDTYYISGQKIREMGYERDVQKGIRLVLIPISDLEILERSAL